jgi:hypothetical protein
MERIENWLDQLGMSEYAQRFAENDIDFTILGELSDQDLKDLGVASLGHRRKILRAISALNGPGAVAPVSPPRARSSPVAGPHRPPDPRQRHRASAVISR